jgi:CheY-like chemotaxis protein/anti-sigma regulatory factor (Ser/Thr protein kinase)
VPEAAVNEAKSIIERQARHLARLTDDLLDAGRVMMGKIELDRRPADLALIVEDAVELLRNTGRLADHDVQLALATAWVNVDVTRLDQVVSNLLTNAVKYTPARGAVRVTVQRDGQEAVLRVADSGLGLDRSLLPRVFDLFVQGERTLERSEGGLGIGLTLVRRIVELHGGRVSAHSDGPDSGSEFVVRLPALASAQAAASSPRPKVEASRRCKVVIVEDNADVRTGLRFLLELEGHEVLEAADGRAGVEVLLHERPDIAFVDLGLPLLDGYAVARTVRQAVGRELLLVAMTGYGTRQDREEGVRAGFDAYLVKPIDAEAVGSILSRLGAGAPAVEPTRQPAGSATPAP